MFYRLLRDCFPFVDNVTINIIFFTRRVVWGEVKVQMCAATFYLFLNSECRLCLKTTEVESMSLMPF